LIKALRFLVKPENEFVAKNLRREFLKRIAPRGNETPSPVLSTKCDLREPASQAVIYDPPPNLSALWAEVCGVVVVDFVVLPPRD
jgi:homogentisate 1,2-dioxygenase